jgi:hypothetical protein
MRQPIRAVVMIWPNRIADLEFTESDPSGRGQRVTKDWRAPVAPSPDVIENLTLFKLT